ncbi:MAG: phosphate-starvation-inducible PsiE family protein [Gammaproteobacteria bacterium]|nr:phosphate-starvation-inducible PsiE family protein [Gammaproteobacteria bacterium]MCY4219875.1 phosphate-starvation-inducible PsiE family protein [Gammaproteobacteria bacterium]MCY4274337.1 phosphate-starvation-inducible PsiE family protein [Gammaproteobacteria bacterium]
MIEKSPKVSQSVRLLGNLLTDTFHFFALFVIGSMVVWSAGTEFLHLMASKRSASIEDILLLFIYLELGAMVGIYFKTKRMPVRFLIYVAITALTRMLVGIIQVDHHLIEEVPIGELPVLPLIYISCAILILAVATLVFRFGSYRYPSDGLQEDSRNEN